MINLDQKNLPFLFCKIPLQRPNLTFGFEIEARIDHRNP